MATNGPTMLLAYLSSDADFRAWCQGIHAALIAVGLVQTADTGQINMSTAVRGSNNAAAGYEIFRFSDALQATAPVFIKIEYGLGPSSSFDEPSLWVTAGSATNGAGVLSQSTARLVAPQNVAKSAGVQLAMYASGDGSRFALAYSVDLSSTAVGHPHAYIAVERTRDSGGVNTADGFIASAGPGAGSSAWKSAAAGTGVAAFGPCLPVSASLGTPTVGANSGVGTMIYFLGLAFYGIGLTALHYTSSPGAGTTFTATVLGALHTYVVLADKAASSSNGLTYLSTAQNVACMLWE